MAAPVEEFPLLAYTCCDVWETAPADSPCWVCGQQTQRVNCNELATYDRLQRPRYLVKQSTDNTYL